MIQIKGINVSTYMASKRKTVISEDSIRQQLTAENYEILEKYYIFVRDLKKLQKKFPNKTQDEQASIWRGLYQQQAQEDEISFDQFKQAWTKAIETLRDIRKNHPMVLRDVITKSPYSEKWEFIMEPETPEVTSYLFKVLDIPDRRSSSREKESKKKKQSQIVSEDESIPSEPLSSSHQQLVSDIAKLTKQIQNSKSVKQTTKLQEQLQMKQDELEKSQRSSLSDRSDLQAIIQSSPAKSDDSDLRELIGSEPSDLGGDDLDAFDAESNIPLSKPPKTGTNAVEDDFDDLDALDADSIIPLPQKPVVEAEDDEAWDESKALDALDAESQLPLPQKQLEEENVDKDIIPDTRKISHPSAKKLAEDIEQTSNYLKELSKGDTNEMSRQQLLDWNEQLQNCFFPNVVLS